MLLTITTTHEPASDLGYLLHKNPARAQSFPLSFGEAHVFYPEAAAERCTAGLLLDVDPVGLVRGRAEGAPEQQYVNDRPYVASSFLSVAIAQVFGSALAGKCRDRPGLAETPIPLEVRVAVVPCRGGEDLLRRLFVPLGYELSVEREPLDPLHPAWGESRYYTLTLRATARLAYLLRSWLVDTSLSCVANQARFERGGVEGSTTRMSTTGTEGANDVTAQQLSVYACCPVPVNCVDSRSL